MSQPLVFTMYCYHTKKQPQRLTEFTLSQVFLNGKTATFDGGRISGGLHCDDLSVFSPEAGKYYRMTLEEFDPKAETKNAN